MKFSNLFWYTKIDKSKLTDEQIEWYQKARVTREALKKKEDLALITREKKHNTRQNYHIQQPEIRLLSNLISTFECHYDFKNKKKKPQKTGPYENINWNGQWIDFTPLRKKEHYYRKKEIGIIEKIIKDLEATKSNVKEIDVFNSIVDLFSVTCYSRSNLELLAKLYLFARTKHSFTLHYRFNSYKKPIKKYFSYLSLHNFLKLNTGLTCKQKFFVSDFITIHKQFNHSKVHSLLKYSYNKEYFTNQDYQVLKDFIPNFRKSLFHETIDKMITLQKKDFPL